MGIVNDKLLLENERAERLYEAVKDLPIIDYHCHLSAKEIAEDKTFSDLTELLLGHDHYKWRIMRTMGVPEKYITGDAPSKEKFIQYARALEYAVGNPLYTWTALELSRVFGIDEALTEKNAGEIFDRCSGMLQSGDISARSIMKSFNVETVCTTDDPADTLEYHKKLKEEGFDIKVLPTFRPDRFLNIESTDFAELMREKGISSYRELRAYLLLRLLFFCENGCAVADHGLNRFPHFVSGDVKEIFERRMNGGHLTQDEIDAFKTGLLLFLGKIYAELGIVMQLHIGVLRNTNFREYFRLGADAGFDSPDDRDFIECVARFLGVSDLDGKLPKTILYSLNPKDNMALAAMAGNFAEAGVRGKVQHGSAWWFNDHRDGISAHIRNLASVGVLGSFVGMLTDSRSFVSYTRHEYFRRILCNELSKFADDGIYADTDKLTEIARDISYYNALNYFEFGKQKGLFVI